MKAPYFLPLRSNCWPFFSIVLLRRGRQAFRIRTVILLLCHNLPLNSLRINKAKQLCVRSGRETAMHRSSHIWPYFMYNADFRRRTNGTWTGDTNNKVLFTANYCVQAGDEERNASRKRIEFISVDFGMAKRCPHIPLFCERNKKILSICLHQRLKGFTKIKTNCTFTISYRTMLGDGFFSVCGWQMIVVICCCCVGQFGAWGYALAVHRLRDLRPFDVGDGAHRAFINGWQSGVAMAMTFDGWLLSLRAVLLFLFFFCVIVVFLSASRIWWCVMCVLWQLAEYCSQKPSVSLSADYYLPLSPNKQLWAGHRCLLCTRPPSRICTTSGHNETKIP